MAMMGCFDDMMASSRSARIRSALVRNRPRCANSGDVGSRLVVDSRWYASIRSTSSARAEHEADALVQRRGLDLEHAAYGRCWRGRRPARRGSRSGWPRTAAAAGRACAGSLVSRGYRNTPPRMRMRWASATSEATQRMLKSLPRGPGAARRGTRRRSGATGGSQNRLFEELIANSRVRGRDPHVRVREEELAESRVEREAVRRPRRRSARASSTGP